MTAAGGGRPIRRLLIANRGEIARRIARTCRALGVEVVAVHADPDADAPFVREADLAVALGGDTPATSYLRADAVLDAARRAGADAVHPGYGFLAEDAAFAQAVLDAGLTWVGPPPAAIAAMGSKVAARARMAAAGVPVLPGSDDPSDPGGVGFPLLVKASAGGGGRGMRVVADADALAGAVASARSEAASAFGDDRVFLERYVPRGRHVEVQLLGDAHGRVIAVGERDCSVQRRHQKVLEEAPSPIVGDALRAELLAAAVTAGEAVGYVGAGTVEFLVDAPHSPPGGTAPEEPIDFYFLEMNTRLQVEHPVTEAVWGLDLVAEQLRLAEGGRVPSLPPAPHGHAIEARLYAEDPAAGFLPQTGTLERLRLDGSVRVDAAVDDGGAISPFYDPMVAKVIAHGATRAEAARTLAGALASGQVQGTTTNRDLLVRLLRSRTFLDGEADTGWLDRGDELPELLRPLVEDEAERARCALAFALAAAARRRADAGALRAMPSGWRNAPSQPQVAELVVAGEEVDVRYRFDRTGRSLAEPADVELVRCSPEEVVLRTGGVARTYRTSTWAVSTLAGEVAVRERERFADPAAAVAAGSLTAPMPGAVVRVLAAPGARVAAGAPLLVLEAMKMEHEVTAPAAGVLAALHVGEGEQVSAGQVLAVVEEG